MPPKPRRSVSRTNSSASQLERAKSAPVGQLRPEAELHTRVAGLEDAERRRLCRALGIEGANPTLGWQALSEHVALLESTPLKELRETALRLGAEATELDRAIEQAEDRKSTALDLVLAAGQRARPPARPPPQLPDRPQDASPPAQVLPGALSTRDDHADDDHEHAAALMAWYRAYDPPKADPQHVARVIRMFKKRARRLAANGSAPADWRLMMHAKFEEHNQVDPRDLLNRPVEPQPHLRPAPREAEAADGDAGPESTIAEARRVVAAERTQCSMELNGMLEDSQSERLGAIPAEPELEPEPQPVHGTMPVEPEPEPADGPTRIPSEPTPDPDLESEPHVDAEQSTEEAVPPRQNHAPAGEPAPSTTTRQEPPVMPEAVPCLTPKELKSISGRWLARGMDADGPGLDEGLLLAVSVGGTVACTIDGDADDKCTIRNARIDPASGWCEMEQVYEVGASTHWRCRYDPSTKHFVEGEWHADGKAIGTFTMEPEPPRKPGQPPRFVTQRKQQPGGELLIKWEVGRELGKGHFATAYEITKLEDRSLWAAKVVSKKSLRDFAGRPERFKEELDIHASLVSDGCVALRCRLVFRFDEHKQAHMLWFDRVRHPNVLFMESFFEDDDFYYIVLEICPYESLLELLAARRTLTEYAQRSVLLTAIIGLAPLHPTRVCARAETSSYLHCGWHCGVQIRGSLHYEADSVGNDLLSQPWRAAPRSEAREHLAWGGHDREGCGLWLREAAGGKGATLVGLRYSKLHAAGGGLHGASQSATRYTDRPGSRH